LPAVRQVAALVCFPCRSGHDRLSAKRFEGMANAATGVHFCWDRQCGTLAAHRSCAAASDTGDRVCVPAAARIAVIVDPGNPDSDRELSDVQVGARAIGIGLDILRASDKGEIDTAFATLARAGAQALLVAGSPFFVAERERIVMLAARHRVPAIYEANSYAAAGGLMSYGPNIPDVYRQVGVYVGQILKGAKPSDLPVIQPTVIELVINRKAATALGLEIPPTLLALADEVIE